MTGTNNISAFIRNALQDYFDRLDGEKTSGVYCMVLKSVERPMLEIVMEEAKGNQTLAAEMLGINRNTLRRKLGDYDLL
ncbi:MAG: Fis family transcriptional regulator [Candidatus Accumulibacter sp.]|jgi:Fis family transcriptional regulator|nr:Fis family transcriptional regulator [Accumulibacter sp.]